jgi:hypothetical protein
MHSTLTFLILTIILAAPILINILRARAGKELYLRPIAGLEAIDEAVGRAVEMGRPIFYSTGLGSITQIDTLSSLAILRRVAQMAAKYDTPVIQTVYNFLVYPVAEEVVREAYAQEGKPDLFNPDDVVYIAGQFPYAAGSVGLMHRNNVAAAFYFGLFYAESLLLAEGGAQIGAIQVAGTAATLQVPFFITTCDYTIIGEELFAASAYLSREPIMLGSLVGQDWGKLAFLVLVVLGTLAASLGTLLGLPSNPIYEIFTY